MGSDQAYIEDILAMISEIESFTAGIDYENFLANRAIYRAVERDFEIIGEAVKRLSEGLKNRYPEIDWQDISGFRNVLIHEYAAVNPATVWDTLRQDMPGLKKALLAEVKKSGFVS